MTTSVPPEATNGSDAKPAICVFCGSSFGSNPEYRAAAESVGRALAGASTELVYGGGQSGLMGVVASSCAKAGGDVHGIIPSAFLNAPAGEKGRAVEGAEAEPVAVPEAVAPLVDGGAAEGFKKKVLLTREGAGKTTVVPTMHARKLQMAKLSPGGFVVLPGGFGSFEELFEMATWSQLAIHKRKVLLLNVAGFYTPLRQQIERATADGFITPSNSRLVRFLEREEGEGEAWNWGREALRAMEEWVWDDRAGYAGLTWEES